MRRLVFLLAAFISIARLGAAGPICASGSLASYVALGSSGCTIGNDVLYDFQVLIGTAGATPISPNSITIKPLGGSYDPGITAQTKMTAAAGTELEAFFTYRIADNYFTSSTITLSGSSETVDGAATDTQDYCAGGTFGPNGVSGCSGVHGTLLTLDGIQNQDSAPLGPAGLLSVTDDFTLDGGLGGSASGGSITDQFTAVPEPVSFLLAGIGIALAAALKLRSALRGFTQEIKEELL